MQESKIDELHLKVYKLRFVDIALLAREMQVPNQCLTPINVEEQPHAIANKVIETYSKQGTDIEINFYDTDSMDDELDGMYTRYHRKDNSVLFDIDIRSTLNRCWRRFVAAKEISHTLIDQNKASFTTNVKELADLLLNQPPNIKNHEDIHSEYLAMYFAVELLLPYNINDQIINKKVTPYKIASMLSVPERMVDLVRTNWYQELRRDSYEDLSF